MKELPIKESTFKHLETIKRKDESFDDVVQRLLIVFEQARRKRLNELKINHSRLAGSRRGMER